MSDSSDFKERRESERFPLLLDSTLSFSGLTFDVVLMDISADGAKFRFKNMPSTMPAGGIEVVIEVPRHGGFYGEVVWTDEDFAGMKFDENHKMAANLVHEMVADSRAKANDKLFPAFPEPE